MHDTTTTKRRYTGVKQTWRKLRRKADIARIHCSTMGCDANATCCNTVHWNTGNATGVSFFCHCAEHGLKRLA